MHIDRTNIGEIVSNTLRYNLIESIFSQYDFTDSYLLDLGCGKKPYQKIYNHKVKKTIGVDVQSSPHLNHDMDIIYDGVNIPFGDNEFEIVLCTEVIEHVLDTEKFLHEIKRILKPNGYLIITFPFLQTLHETPNDFFRFTPFFIKNKMEQLHFTIVQNYGISGELGFIISQFVKYPLKAFNQIAKFFKMKFIHSIYNPIIFLFLIIPQLIYLFFARTSSNIYSTKTYKSYCFVITKNE